MAYNHKAELLKRCNFENQIDNKCKFKLVYPPISSEHCFEPVYNERKKIEREKTREWFKLQCIKCHPELKKRKAELKRKRIIQKIKRVYKINLDGFKQETIDEIIKKEEILEKQKKEKEQKKIKENAVMLKRLVEEYRLRQKDLRVILPLRRKRIKSVEDLEVFTKSIEGGSIGEGEKCKSKESSSIDTLQKEKDKRYEEARKDLYPCREMRISSRLENSEKLIESSDSFQDTSHLSLSMEEIGPEDNQIICDDLRKPPKHIECCLESSPKKVIFKDFEKGKVYIQSLKITNISLDTIHVRYLGIAVREKTEERFPVGVAVRDSVKVRPGLLCSTKVRFCTDNPNLELKCSIVYETRRKNKPLKHSWFLVPVSCVPARAIVKVSPVKLIFPSLTWCAATSPEGLKLFKKTIKIENTGAKACTCKISGVSMKPETPKSADDFTAEDSFETTSTLIDTISEEPSFCRYEFMGEEYLIPCDILQAIKFFLVELIGNIFEIFKFSQKYHIVLPPFSTTYIDVKFIPEYKGFHHEIQYLQFDNCYNLDEIPIELSCIIKRLPISAKPQVLDFRTCIANGGIYSLPFTVYNESKEFYSVRIKLPFHIRKHALVFPKYSIIKPFCEKHFYLKFFPRASLAQDTQKYFTPESGILEFPIFIFPANVGACKSDCIKIYALALVTDYTLELLPAVIDFGIVNTLEMVRTEINLINHSLAPQEYGFLNLPKEIRIEPDFGFGVILPKEILKLYVIYSPGSDLIKGNKNTDTHTFHIRATCIAECCGFDETSKPETQKKEFYKSIWNENTCYQQITLEESYPSNKMEIIEELSEEGEECVETSSIEAEDMKEKIQNQENKIREIIKQDRKNLSELSFFPRMKSELQNENRSSFRKVRISRIWKNSPIIVEKEEDLPTNSSKPGPPNRAIKCKAVVLEPRCQVSESVINLPPTPYCSYSLYKFRLLGYNPYKDLFCICEHVSNKPNIIPNVQPKFKGYFEFQNAFSEIKIEPQSGYITEGDDLPITIAFRPEFPARVLEQESKAIKGYKLVLQTAAEKELSSIKLNESKAKQRKKSGITKTLSIVENSELKRSFQLEELNKSDLFLGEKRLLERVDPYSFNIKICCLIKTIRPQDSAELVEIHDILLICRITKPHFIFLGDLQEINFGKIPVGSRVQKVLEIKNISLERISPLVSLLNPVGPFICPGGLKKLEVDPEHIWRQPLTYVPQEVNKIDQEFFEITYGPTNILLIVKGESISPREHPIPNVKFDNLKIETIKAIEELHHPILQSKVEEDSMSQRKSQLSDDISIDPRLSFQSKISRRDSRLEHFLKDSIPESRYSNIGNKASEDKPNLKDSTPESKQSSIGYKSTEQEPKSPEHFPESKQSGVKEDLKNTTKNNFKKDSEPKKPLESTGKKQKSIRKKDTTQTITKSMIRSEKAALDNKEVLLLNLICRGLSYQKTQFQSNKITVYYLCRILINYLVKYVNCVIFHNHKNDIIPFAFSSNNICIS